MAKNRAIKVNYVAFSQAHEIIVPAEYTIGELTNYLRCICSTFIITDMNPTTRDITI